MIFLSPLNYSGSKVLVKRDFWVRVFGLGGILSFRCTKWFSFFLMLRLFLVLFAFPNGIVRQNDCNVCT
jgi:hypothetical protein